MNNETQKYVNGMLVTVNHSRSIEVEQALIAAAKHVYAQDKEAILGIKFQDYVSDTEYAKYRLKQDILDKQFITKQLHHRNMAWQLYNYTGIINNSETYDYFYHNKNRRRFLNFYIRTRGLANAIDRYENTTERFIFKRRFETGKDKFIADVLKAIWGATHYRHVALSKKKFTDEQLLQLLYKARIVDRHAYIEEFAKKANTLLSADGNHISFDDHIEVITYVLLHDGMLLHKEQRNVGGQLQYLYSFDAEQYRKLEQYAIARDEYLKVIPTLGRFHDIAVDIENDGDSDEDWGLVDELGWGS